MIRELNNRNSDGIDVTLLWDDSNDEILLQIGTVADEHDSIIIVPPDKAMDAFNHPFLYLAAARERTLTRI